MARTIAHGAKLQIGDGAAPENFTDIPYIGAFSIPIADAEVADVTSHTESYHEEIESPIPQVVEMPVPLTWDPAEQSHVDLRDLARDHTPRNFQAVTVSGATYLISGAKVKSRELELGLVNKAETFNFKLRIFQPMVISDAA